MIEGKPLIAVTLGDPAGIGPEIVVGAWNRPGVHESCRPIAIGHPEMLAARGGAGGIGLQVVEIGSPEEAIPSADIIPCLACGSDDALDVLPGTIDARAGQAAYEAIVAAAAWRLDRRVDAITTGPCTKALHAAGHHYPGHTELLAEMCRWTTSP